MAVVVDPGEISEFVRKDGGKGQVRGVLLGDETGKIRLTLWNEQAQMPLAKGETIEVINGSSRERYGSLEIQTGSDTVVRKSSQKLDYSREDGAHSRPEGRHDLQRHGLCDGSWRGAGVSEG